MPECQTGSAVSKSVTVSIATNSLITGSKLFGFVTTGSPTLFAEANDSAMAVRAFCLVLATTIPAALPFFLFEEGYAALRGSHALLVLLLFVIGFIWGGNVGARPLFAGALIMSIGVALVVIAIPLGG